MDTYSENSRFVWRNIGIVIALRYSETGLLFVLGTTYLLWDTYDSDVKAVHAADCVTRSVEFAPCTERSFVTLSGDLNSTPELHEIELPLNGSTILPSLGASAPCSDSRTTEASLSSPTTPSPGTAYSKARFARYPRLPEESIVQLPENQTLCHTYDAMVTDVLEPL